MIYEGGGYVEMIEMVRPDILVNSNNRSSSEVVERNLVEQNGGEFVLLDLKSAIQRFS